MSGFNRLDTQSQNLTKRDAKTGENPLGIQHKFGDGFSLAARGGLTSGGSMRKPLDKFLDDLTSEVWRRSMRGYY